MPIEIVADWDYIVRTLVRVRDGRVNPRVKPEDGHDEAGESILSAPGIILQQTPLVTPRAAIYLLARIQLAQATLRIDDPVIEGG
jgi:hypothetical protein